MKDKAQHSYDDFSEIQGQTRQISAKHKPITAPATVVTVVAAAPIRGHNGCSLSNTVSNKLLPKNSTIPQDKKTDSFESRRPNSTE